MFYFLIIDDTGVPGKLVGPMEWAAGVRKIIDTLENDPDLDKAPLSDESKDHIDMDGMYEYADGGGIYLLVCEDG